MFDFQSVLDDLDNVPDEFKGLYSAGDDGKFVLHAKLNEKLTQGSGARNALRTVRNEKAQLEKTVKRFKEISGVDTPEDLEQRITDLEGKATTAAGADDRVAAVKSDLEKTYKTQLTELQTTLNAEREENDREHRDRMIMEAISTSDAIGPALAPILRERVKVVREDGKRRLVVKDENGEDVLDGHGAPILPKAYVERLRADENYGFAFKPTGVQGAGSGTNTAPKGFNGVNPFDAKTRNMTAAQELIQKNPERARALAQQANYPVTW